MANEYIENKKKAEEAEKERASVASDFQNPMHYIAEGGVATGAEAGEGEDGGIELQELSSQEVSRRA